LCSNKRYVLLGVARSFGGTQKITGIHRQEGINNNWNTRRGDAKTVVSSLEQRISCAFFVPIIVSLDEETFGIVHIVLESPVVGWSQPVSVGWTVKAIVVVAVVVVVVIAIIAVG